MRDDLLEKEGCIKDGKFDDKVLSTMSNLEISLVVPKEETTELEENETNTVEQEQEKVMK